ncbi:hypothetical protein [Actinomadura sp. WAC 06369]|nr:hypothetical protein [Actinomadura sp. WAC 06369]RSN68127.1 hypothetical protein DMH08_12005 [Actinomadura sp. WAC 06369]
MAVLGAAGGPYPAVVVGAVFVFYGLVTWGIAPATQAWLLDRGGPDAAGELLAVNNACMYLGFSLAGGVGGLALGAGGAAAVPVAAAGCAGLSLVLFAAALVGRRDADR